MALAKSVSAESCGVKPTSEVESLELMISKGGMQKPCQGEAFEDRMHGFLTFLDQTASNSLHAELGPTNPLQSANGSSNENLLSKISALEVELEDKEHSLKALQELREREKLKHEHMQKQLILQLREEKATNDEKYENQVRRHQEQLSQVQEEKKGIAARCERLSDEMRELERKFAARTAELHKQYGRELERQKKSFLSGERARREAWERDRAQEIKDITIRGLEPEIQRLLEKHRSEKRCLEEKLKRIATDIKSQLEQEVALQKTLLTKQMEDALEVERSQHKKEIRDLQENFGSQLRKERETLVAKHREESNKWESQINDGKKSIEGAIKKAREEEKLRSKELANQMVAEMDRIKNNHLAEARKAAEAAKAKETEMIRAMEAAKATAVQEAVAATRREVEAECNRKLDHLLERLSREQLEVHARFERQCNEAVAASQASTEQMRQEFEKERGKLEAELREAHEKRLGLERQISRLETEAELKEKLRAELQMALDELSERTQALISETDTKTQALKAEWERDKQQYEQQRQEFETQKELLDSVTSQLDEARKEIQGMKAQETKRLETLEAKVKETLFAKDQAIQQLRDELSASKTKVDRLRRLMSKQRTEFIQGATSCDPFPIESAASTSASLLPPSEINATEIGAKPVTLSRQTGQLTSKFNRMQTGTRDQQDQKSAGKKPSR